MYDIIVIGAGPAGLNSALYALRNGKKVLVLEANIIGGQISNSPKVENLPSIKSISGIDFAMKFGEQIEQIDIESGEKIRYEKVEKILKDNDIFTVVTDSNTYESKAVIAATGVTHKHIGIPGEKEFLGKGVYYCALCDGPFYEGKEVAVIGDGNTAMQYALLLSNICSKVHMLTWSDKFYGEKLVEDTLKSRNNIIHISKVSATEFKGDSELQTIIYKKFNSSKYDELEVPAVFIAIGQIPQNNIFKDFAEFNDLGYFIANEDMSTKTPGLFVAGDCRVKKVRQVVTAVSDGAIAAISACNYVDNIK